MAAGRAARARKAPWPALIGAILVVACQAETPSPSIDVASPVGSTAPASQPSAPPATHLDVTIVTEPGRSASAKIGPKGGSLKLDLGRGTTATLSIPPDALLESAAITMKATSIKDWPDGPPDQSSVQLEPDGLELFAPASLMFEQAAIGADGTHGEVAWSGQGRGLHAALAKRSAGRVSFTIDHFSGYGLVWNIGTESYWQSWTRTTTDAAAADLESDLATLFGWWRLQELHGIDHPALGDIVGRVVDTWYDSVYEPTMRDGETTCEGGRMALAQLGTMIRMLETMGISAVAAYQSFLLRRREGQSTQFRFDQVPDDYLDALLERCDGEALEHCRATGDIGLLLMYVAGRRGWARSRAKGCRRFAASNGGNVTDS